MMPSLPSMSMGSSATGGTAATGMSGWGNGDWSVNIAGSGQALQGASGGMSPWLIGGLVVAGVVAWLVLRK